MTIVVAGSAPVNLAEVNLMDAQWGVVGDDTADDWAAITAVIQSVGTSASPVGTTIRVPGWKLSGGVPVPRVYRLSKPLHLNRVVEIVAESTTGPGYGGAIFQFDPGVHGIVVDSDYTYARSIHGGFGDNSIIRGLTINGQASARYRTVTDAVITSGNLNQLTSATASFTSADVGLGLVEDPGAIGSTQNIFAYPGTIIATVVNSTTVTLSEPAIGTGSGITMVIGGGCGMIMNAPARLDDMAVGGTCGGHGILIWGSVSASNANGWVLDHPSVTGAKLDGIHVQGDDANAGLCTAANVNACVKTGVRDESFLGNTWTAPQVAGCGTSIVIGSAANGGNVNQSTVVGPYIESGQGTAFYGEYVTTFGGGPGSNGPGTTVAGYNGALWTSSNGSSNRYVAMLDSPVFTGTPEAPTPTTSDNSTKLATTAYVKAQPSGAGVFTSVDSLSATPRSVTDWGPLINAAIAAGETHLVFGLYDYPYSTPIACNGQATGVVFEGARGLGFYVGSDLENTPARSRLMWTGGASPTVTKTDGAMTAAGTTLTSASAPFSLYGSENVYYNGMPITVVGAGVGGANLVTQIASVSSTTAATLATAASTTVSGASFSFTNWTSAINGRGSTGVQFKEIDLYYNNLAFDGILIDLRSQSTWSARGNLTRCEIGGAVNYGDPYALIHLNGHGELFHAEDCSFARAKACIRGMYNNNADDCTFSNCSFTAYSKGAVVNPGRFWRFERCIFAGNGGPGTGALVGSAFGCDGVMGASLASYFKVEQCSFWDNNSFSQSDGAITSGQAILTSALAQFDAYSVGRPISVAGAGAAGGFLVTSIQSVQSATQATLAANAQATVSGATYVVTGSYIFDQKPGYQWDVTVNDPFFWFPPAPEMNLQGPGSLVTRHWQTTRPIRSDLTPLLYGTAIDLGPSSTAGKYVRIEDAPALGTPNLAADSNLAIANYDGHILTSLSGVTFGPERTLVSLQHHDTLNTTNHGNPTLTTVSGQTALASYSLYGHDTAGVISVATTSSGAIAGGLVTVTFRYTWPSGLNEYDPNGWGIPAVQLTPVGISGNSDGAASAAANAYVITTDNDTTWTLAIANAVSGAHNLAWVYRVIKL